MMMEFIKGMARKGADVAGARFLMGRGANRVQGLLPRPAMHSAKTDWDNVLILAPHPDDEVFGACLLIGKLCELGKQVTIAFATNGGAYSTGSTGDRKKEAEASARRLGAEAVFLGLRDGRLRDEVELADMIATLCAQNNPQAVVLPWFGDYHPDHRALARAAISQPYLQAQYMFYATFSPLWPNEEFQLSFLIGGEEKLLDALAGYQVSVNQETINGFLVLRRTLARAYLNNSTFWEPYLSISGTELANTEELAAKWPPIRPTLKKARHWRSFINDLRKLGQAIGETK